MHIGKNMKPELELGWDKPDTGRLHCSIAQSDTCIQEDGCLAAYKKLEHLGRPEAYRCEEACCDRAVWGARGLKRHVGGSCKGHALGLLQEGSELL